MLTSQQLDSYFERIGWNQFVQPDLPALEGLLQAHVTKIPFENFDVLLGRPIRLDGPSLIGKLCSARRGGYCYEHATLLALVLEALGYRISRHVARILRVAPRPLAHRGHMLLSVDLEGDRYIVDPGFSAYSAFKPLPLSPKFANDTHRLTFDGSEWTLFVKSEGREFAGWCSTLEAETDVDVDMANYYTSTHPHSLFRKMLMASAVTSTGRVSLMNDSVTQSSGDEIKRFSLVSRDELRGVVSAHFGFDLPELETMPVPAVRNWGA